MHASGQDAQAALKKAAAWGTALACGAGDGIYIKGHSLKFSQDIKTPSELGRSKPNAVARGAIRVPGDVPALLRYYGLDLFIALAMGASGTPAQQEATAAYLQTFTIADSLDGLFATFCWNNNVNIDEYSSIKVTGWDIEGEYGGFVDITFHVIAIDKEESSVINTSVTFANVTFSEASNIVLFSDGVFRLNDQTGDALAEGDVIHPSSFKLASNRKLEGAPGVGGANTVDEPGNAGEMEVKLSLNFPRYTAETHFTDLRAGTEKKADIVFTGSVIEDAYSNQFKVEMPRLVYVGADVPPEPGPLKHPLEFLVVGCDAAPTGMAGITDPFKVTTINEETADVLA